MVRAGVRIISWYIWSNFEKLSTVGHGVLLNPYTTVGHRDTLYFLTAEIFDPLNRLVLPRLWL